MKTTRTLQTSLILVLAAIFASHAFAGVFFSVNIAPPPLPVYAQPPCPGDGYIWTPGFWQYGDYGYYWVPGHWVLAPRAGLLWTPGYWGWGNGVYLWHAGYWGPHVGFYGGINYGYGYFGSGFAGGRWVGGAFHYNTAVTNVNVTNVHNTYVEHVQNNNYGASNHSFNGPGGVHAQASHHEMAASRAPHTGPTSAQQAHAQQAHAAHLAAGPHGGGGGGGRHR